MHPIRTAALAATALVAVPAVTQETGDAGPPSRVVGDKPDRNTIVVIGRSFVVDDAASATKTDTPIIETPQAVSVVDSDFIQGLNLRTVAEALNYTSGVRFQAFGSDTRIEYYQLRGCCQSNANRSPHDPPGSLKVAA